MPEMASPAQTDPSEDLVGLDIEGYLPNYSSPEDFLAGHKHPEEWEPAVIAVAYHPDTEAGWIEHHHNFGEEPNPSQVIREAMECISSRVPSDAKLVTYNGTRYDIRMMSSTSDITPLIGREHYDLHRWVECLDHRKMRLDEALERHGAAIEVDKPNQAARIASDIANGRTNGQTLTLLDYLTADVRRLPELAKKLMRRFRAINEAPPTWTVQRLTEKDYNQDGDDVATDGGREE